MGVVAERCPEGGLSTGIQGRMLLPATRNDDMLFIVAEWVSPLTRPSLSRLPPPPPPPQAERGKREELRPPRGERRVWSKGRGPSLSLQISSRSLARLIHLDLLHQRER